MDNQRPRTRNTQPTNSDHIRPVTPDDPTVPSVPQPQESSERYWWHRQTIAETFQRIMTQPEFPWVAIGDFIDEWRRSDPADRLALVAEGIPGPGGIPPSEAESTDEFLLRWAAFCAAMVEWLCWQSDLSWPTWTNREEYHLPTPWFLYPGDLLRPWELVTTPAPFKARNIFGGDHILDRV